jgi:cell division protein FtsZ
MKKKRKKPVSGSKEFNPLANIKVVGVGGSGGNMVSRMSQGFIRGVDFVAINTDHQALDWVEVKRRIYIGKNLTKGLGTGMNPDLGRQAAEENRSEIAQALQGADIVFIAGGFGGGTATGAMPIVAEAAKQTGALTIAFVAKPFAFEGTQRQRIAEEGLMKIKDKVDALIVVPNDRIFTVIGKDTPILKAFEGIDEILKNTILGIVELILAHGIVNVDFADVRAVIQDAGSAIVGVGIASGPDRAVQAVNLAMNSPLLEVNPEGARGVLLGVSGGKDLRMTEINEAAKIVAQAVDPGARIIFGAYYDKNLKPNQIKITLIATGFASNQNTTSLFSNNSFITSEKKDFYSQPPKMDPQPREERQPGLGMRAQDLLREDGHSSPRPSPSASHGSHPKDPLEAAQTKKETKKTDSDVWDIPTFLRRRKK